MSPKSEEPVVGEKPDIQSVLRAGRPSRRIARTTIWIAVAAVAGAAAWYGWASLTSGEGEQYVTEPAARGDLTVIVTATGTVEPTNEVEISSELSGTIRSVEAGFNDVVTEGQILARLNTDKLEANVELARATLAAREADVAQAAATAAEMAAAYERAVQLDERGVSSQQTFDAAKAANDRADAALASARAAREIAEANLRIAEADLDKACICSPIDGVVLDRNVEVGQIVASTLQAPVLFTLAEDLTQMELQVAVDEADVGAIEEGDAATFTVEAYPRQSFAAKITQIQFLPATVEGVVTYKAILSVDNSDLLLRPGMTATARIVVQEAKDVLTVPNAAFRYAPSAKSENDGGGAGLLGLLLPRRPGGPVQSEVNEEGKRTLWVLREGVPVAASVATGATDGTKTEIVGGDVEAGDPVIVGGRTGS